MWLRIHTVDVTVEYGDVYSTGDVPVDNGAVDPYWGGCGIVFG